MAGIVAAPMAAQADLGAYGSMRIGLQHLDTKGNSELTVRGYGSRFGLKGESDLGNGMTGFGAYEFQVATEASNTADNNPQAAAITRRKAYAGIKGDFGSVRVGQDYHTFYSHVVGPLDNPWWGSGYNMISYTGRTDNGLTYAGEFGAVSVGVTAYLSNSGAATTPASLGSNNTGGGSNAAGEPENIDGTEIGVSFDAGPVRIGLGIQSKTGLNGVDPEDVIGIAVSGIALGPVNLGISYQSQDQAGSLTDTGMVLDLGFNSFYGHYEAKTEDGVGAAAKDKTSLTLGYTQSIGTGTTMYYEYQTLDADDAAGTLAAASGDKDWIRAVLVYSWK
jgi:predicted porin